MRPDEEGTSLGSTSEIKAILELGTTSTGEVGINTIYGSGAQGIVGQGVYCGIRVNMRKASGPKKVKHKGISEMNVEKFRDMRIVMFVC